MTAEASPPPPPLGERPAGLIQTGFAAWLRRYRRSLPIPLAILVLIFFPPTYPLASPGLDLLSDIVGTAVCLLGQWLRAWAWGSNAEVAKFGVRERGPYALMRHPLYAGNFLIVLGLVVVYHNPWVYPLLLLPFAYLYDAITKLEEHRLHWRFTQDYEGYRAVAVPRFLPALSHLPQAFGTTLTVWLAAGVAQRVRVGVRLAGRHYRHSALRRRRGRGLDRGLARHPPVARPADRNRPGQCGSQDAETQSPAQQQMTMASPPERRASASRTQTPDRQRRRLRPVRAGQRGHPPRPSARDSD